MLRLGVVPDFAEENWPSMDLVAKELFGQIAAGAGGDVSAVDLRPAYAKRFSRVPLLKGKTALNADRFLNRMRRYPVHLKKFAKQFDAFHVCDHAYANVVHALPAEKCGVFCHDLDTFRCLFEPEKERRPRWFQSMMRRVLGGLQKAAVIFHTTDDVRRQLVARGIADEARLVKAPYGVSPVFTPEGERKPGRYVLHVGSGIQRKRLDVLLDVFARLREAHRDLTLIQIGATWSDQQAAQIERLGIGKFVTQFPRLPQSEIASFYRGAQVVLMPSDAEGFGLPVIEALACGSVVVASGIASLMEAGGSAAVYCGVGEVDEWARVVDEILRKPARAPTREARLAQAGTFSWAAHARIICEALRKISD